MQEPDVTHFLPTLTHAPAETEALGQQLASLLAPGDVLALHGDLGAGKTRLVRGLCAGLKIDPEGVSSPTFTIVQEYPGPVPVFHIDAYRLKSAEELLDLGFEDYLTAGGICVIEWPSRVSSLLPAGTRHLLLRHGGGDERYVAWCDAEGHVDARPPR